jgi:hypothetical protein
LCECLTDDLELALDCRSQQILHGVRVERLVSYELGDSVGGLERIPEILTGFRPHRCFRAMPRGARENMGLRSNWW